MCRTAAVVEAVSVFLFLLFLTCVVYVCVLMSSFIITVRIIRIIIMQLCTTGNRSFCVTTARAWNSLPPSITSAPSLTVFKRQWKTFLFDYSFS